MKKIQEKITLVIFLKTIFTWTLVAVLISIEYLIFVPLVLIWLILFDWKNKKSMFYLTRLFIRIFFKLYITANFNIDLLNLKKADGPRIYILNHASPFDTFLMYLLPDKFKVFVKQAYVKIPFIGWTILLTGNILVKKTTDLNYETDLVESGIKAIKNNYSLIIYPEGTKSRTGDIGRFKSGGFRIAYETRAEIVPVILDTWNSIRPGGGWWIRDDRIWMKILKPYQYKDYKDIEINDFAKILKVKMTEELIKIRDQRRKNEKNYYRNGDKYIDMDKNSLDKAKKIKEKLI